MNNKDINVVSGRQQQRFEDNYDEQNNFIFKNKNQVQNIAGDFQFQKKGNNLTIKIIIIIGLVALFYIVNAIFYSTPKIYVNWKDKITQIQDCPNQKSLFQGKCVKSCPKLFKKHSTNNICISEEMQSNQIKITHLQGNFTQIEIVPNDFVNYQQALEDSKNNQMTGLVFFNEFANDDFTFLFQTIQGSTLQKFLSAVNGVIVTFSGADKFYITNGESITKQIKMLEDKYPQISKWYTFGFGFSGSFNALKYFVNHLDIFAGTFLQDPAENLESFASEKDINDILNNDSSNGHIVDLTHLLNKETVKVFKKEIVVFKNRYYTNSVKTPYLSKLVSPTHIQMTYFDNHEADYSTKINYFSDTVFSIIEQYLNIPKRDITNQTND